jgi:uncharacterized membrane protein SirB2
MREDTVLEFANQLNIKMQSIIIIIVSGMLLLASGARAEITYMNCKFNEGWHKKSPMIFSIASSWLMKTLECLVILVICGRIILARLNLKAFIKNA